MDVLVDIKRFLVPDLDVRDVEVVDNALDPFDLPGGSGSESEEPKVVVLGLDETDDLAVGGVSGRLVRLI